MHKAIHENPIVRSVDSEYRDTVAEIHENGQEMRRRWPEKFAKVESDKSNRDS
jgi:hypothetical protein